VNQTDSTISAFTINRTSGALAAVSGSPFSTGPAPTAVAINPASSLVYVTSGNAGTVSVYAINAGGALTAIAGSPFTAVNNYTANLDQGGLHLSGTVMAVDHFNHTWRDCHSKFILGFTLDGAGIRTEIAKGQFTIIGRTELQGQRAIELKINVPLSKGFSTSWYRSPGLRRNCAAFLENLFRSSCCHPIPATTTLFSTWYAVRLTLARLISWQNSRNSAARP
jgi:hypothetical protein